MKELEKYFEEKRVPLSPLKRGSYEFRNFLFFFGLSLYHVICNYQLILYITSKGIVYFLGILTGIALAIAAVFVINKTNSSSDELTMFKERGKMMDAESYMIIQTHDNNHALAVDSDMLAISTIINIPSSINTAVYIIGNGKSSFYDGLEIKSSEKIKFYQVGTYRYKTKEEEWKTVPAVMLMKK